MPRSMFRKLEAVEDPDRHARFLKIIDNLMQRLEDQPRMDLRDYVTACALIDKVLAREKDDESDRGSAVYKYAPEFKKAYGAGRRAATTGQLPDDEAGKPDRGADAGEPADAEDDDPAA